MKNSKLSQYVEKAKKVHNDRYLYDKNVHADSLTDKGVITCPIHGDFIMDWKHHIYRKQGCPKCKSEKLRKIFHKTNETFIKECEERYGNNYDFSKVNYINSNTKVTIICPKHGEFERLPNSFLNGYECENCMGHCKHNKMSQEEFIDNINKKYGIGTFDISKVEYENINSKIWLKCIKHNKWFERSAYEILHKNACPLCGKENSVLKRTKSTEYFVKRSVKIHDNRYSYLKSIYKGENQKLTVTCPIHGDFEITPSNHYAGKGCSFCNKSHIENEVEVLLSENNIDFISQYKPSFLKTIGQQSLDVFIPSCQIAIECQGVGHFYEDYPYLDLKTQIERDERKYKLCKKNNVTLFYYIPNKNIEISKLNNKNIYQENVFRDKQTLLDTIYLKIREYK